MKRIILCISMLFMVMVFTHAQEKANVLVEKFTAEGGYTDSDIRTLRENVMSSLVYLLSRKFKNRLQAQQQFNFAQAALEKAIEKKLESVDRSSDLPDVYG